MGPFERNKGTKLTNGCLTKLLISNFIGDVCTHQHAHGDIELLLDHVRDEFESIWTLVYALREQKHNMLVSGSNPTE